MKLISNYFTFLISEEPEFSSHDIITTNSNLITKTRSATRTTITTRGKHEVDNHEHVDGKDRNSRGMIFNLV